MAPKKSKSASAPSKRRPKLLRVEISRRRWQRGQDISGLRMEDTGKQCCLGFACRAAGLKIADINNNGYPYDVKQNKIDLPPVIDALVTVRAEADDDVYYGNSDLCKQLTEINDNQEIDDKEREKLLKPLALQAGMRFVFKS